MKDPMEVLEAKEQELLRLRSEIEALKLAAHLLDQETAAYDRNAGYERKVDYRQVVEMP